MTKIEVRIILAGMPKEMSIDTKSIATMIESQISDIDAKKIINIVPYPVDIKSQISPNGLTVTGAFCIFYEK